MIVHSLPESLSVIATVSSDQVDMAIEALDYLICAKLVGKRDPNNLQDQN